MDSRFWDTVRQDMLSSTAALSQHPALTPHPPPKTAVDQTATPVAEQTFMLHRAPATFHGGFAAAPPLAAMGAPQSVAISSSGGVEAARAELLHLASRLDDIGATNLHLRGEVDKLRGIVVRHHQELDQVHVGQQVIQNEVNQAKTTMLEQAALKPAQDAWTARIEAAMRVAQQHGDSLRQRVEAVNMLCHDRPTRSEVVVVCNSALQPLASQIEVITQQVLKHAHEQHAMAKGSQPQVTLETVDGVQRKCLELIDASSVHNDAALREVRRELAAVKEDSNWVKREQLGQDKTLTELRANLRAAMEAQLQGPPPPPPPAPPTLSASIDDAKCEVLKTATEQCEQLVAASLEAHGKATLQQAQAGLDALRNEQAARDEQLRTLEARLADQDRNLRDLRGQLRDHQDRSPTLGDQPAPAGEGSDQPAAEAVARLKTAMQGELTDMQDRFKSTMRSLRDTVRQEVLAQVQAEHQVLEERVRGLVRMCKETQDELAERDHKIAKAQRAAERANEVAEEVQQQVHSRLKADADARHQLEQNVTERVQDMVRAKLNAHANAVPQPSPVPSPQSQREAWKEQCSLIEAVTRHVMDEVHVRWQAQAASYSPTAFRDPAVVRRDGDSLRHTPHQPPPLQPVAPASPAFSTDGGAPDATPRQQLSVETTPRKRPTASRPPQHARPPPAEANTQIRPSVEAHPAQSRQPPTKAMPRQSPSPTPPVQPPHHPHHLQLHRHLSPHLEASSPLPARSGSPPPIARAAAPEHGTPVRSVRAEPADARAREALEESTEEEAAPAATSPSPGLSPLGSAENPAVADPRPSSPASMEHGDDQSPPSSIDSFEDDGPSPLAAAADTPGSVVSAADAFEQSQSVDEIDGSDSVADGSRTLSTGALNTMTRTMDSSAYDASTDGSTDFGATDGTLSQVPAASDQDTPPHRAPPVAEGSVLESAASDDASTAAAQQPDGAASSPASSASSGRASHRSPLNRLQGRGNPDLPSPNPRLAPLSSASNSPGGQSPVGPLGAPPWSQPLGSKVKPAVPIKAADPVRAGTDKAGAQPSVQPTNNQQEDAAAEQEAADEPPAEYDFQETLATVESATTHTLNTLNTLESDAGDSGTESPQAAQTPLEPSVRHWDSDRLSAYIRDVLGLRDLAVKFKDKRIDSKAAGIMEREDLVAPPEEGFGLQEDDQALDTVWAFLLELRETMSSASVSASATSSAVTVPALGGGVGHTRARSNSSSTTAGGASDASTLPAGASEDPDERVEKQLRAEGWTKHVAKSNNKPFWTKVGVKGSSTWERPVPVGGGARSSGPTGSGGVESKAASAPMANLP